MDSDLTAPLHAVSVTGIVLRDDGCLLAIKRMDDGTWVPPGGMLELGEGLERGVVREVLEETGVTVHPLRLTGVYKNISRRTVSIAFLCHVVEGEPHVSDEASDVRWMTPREAHAVMPPLRALRVSDALDANGPFVRSY
ncbi:8-oxo-dGTP diphosphatase [Streptomyces aurantiacus]|uniref:NUDIX hydrolase n=1 Tax=Streptomyces aurantiacus TaxID=47760 RepID=UPI0027938430|nr:NUDIX hydrolase [Streptomyces aurantiacus]MDQ0777117.1 8-oxo-dGTP diphosphatase [Streptomyces aurantiacus]